MEINLNDQDIQRLVELLAPRLVAAIAPLLKTTLSKDSQDGNALFSVKQLSEYLGVKPSWIYEKTHFKEIPFIKCGRFPKFRKKEVDKWLEDRKFKPLR